MTLLIILIDIILNDEFYRIQGSFVPQWVSSRLRQKMNINFNFDTNEFCDGLFRIM